jgi:hypothetical protein
MAGRGGFFGWRRALEWTLIPVAFVLMRFVPTRPSGTGWVVLLAGAVLMTLPAVLASHREYAKDKLAHTAEQLALEYRSRLGRTMGEAVIPIGDLLGRISMAQGADRAGLQGQLRQRVVDAAAGLVGAAGPRAVFYALEGRTLRVAAWAGRPDAPVTVLARSDPATEAAYAMLEHRERILVRSTRRRGAVDLGLGGDYATWLAVPVALGARALGIVTLDARAAGTLETSDVEIVAALAQMLATGLAPTAPLGSPAR